MSHSILEFPAPPRQKASSRTRETVTFSAGAFGNDRPIVATKEHWYSPQLDTNLPVVRTDLGIVTQMLNITELNLAEPDPNIFKLPDGCKIEDEPSLERTE